MSDIRVMVVDDSAVVRQVLSGIVNEAPGMAVIAAAADPIFARRKLEAMTPDVILLDIEMPRMDGLTFLAELMADNPIPVVMCSTLTRESSEISVRALRLGALEIIAKPVGDLKHGLQEQKGEIVDAIRAAARARLDRLHPDPSRRPPGLAVAAQQTADAVLPRRPGAACAPATRVVAIGTSTGGTQALEFLLAELEDDIPGILVVQHMPEAFTAAFARRLDSISPVPVSQAEDGDRVETGRVLIAPGGRHMLLDNRAGRLSVRIKDGPLVSRHRPSVDVLFRSVAQAATKQAMGIIMTGMGADGAAGLREMYDAGAYTVAQDEASCVIFGMPAVAIERGGVRRVSALKDLPGLINRFNRPREFEACLG